MKHIAELVKGSISNGNFMPPPAISKEAQSLVDLLFVALEEHVKYFRLNHLEGNDKAKREWTKTFMACQISKEQVQRGITRLRTNGIVYPTLTPAEFLELCAIAPEDIGAPDVEAAYLDGCKNSHPSQIEKNWSHKVVRHATHRTGSHFLRTESRAASFSEFKKNYAEACQMFFDGRIMEQIGNDSPQLRREIEETQKIVAEGYEQYNSPTKALGAIKDFLK